MAGKCPKCEQIVSRLSIKPLLGQGPSGQHKSITLNCPACDTILGAQVDPSAAKSDLVAEIRKLREA
ncbi:hypothetical protein [Montanilutibacter psychrotolerans]|nr:hypothetical protein [Lysobacter psychrotolerans]